VHVDVKYLPQMPDEPSRQYLFAAIDRATRWVYVEILPEKSAHHAQAFLKRLLAAAPVKITKVLRIESETTKTNVHLNPRASTT
jgi:transposase-like protein